MMRCNAPGCGDGHAQNGAETDIDCGGGTCIGCDPGETCGVGTDCLSGVCMAGVCVAPTCTDGVANGSETGVDCGGPSGCPLCPDGQGCASASDCVTGTCTMGICGTCPGVLDGSTCIYLPSTASAPNQATARTQCTALGPGWDLCPGAIACLPVVESYLSSSGCNCGGGAATCACGTADNLYVHVDGTSPLYIRSATTTTFPGCISSNACTTSGSEVCGVALCCR